MQLVTLSERFLRGSGFGLSSEEFTRQKLVNAHRVQFTQRGERAESSSWRSRMCKGPVLRGMLEEQPKEMQRARTEQDKSRQVRLYKARDQDSANLFCRGPGSKYFRFCHPGGENHGYYICIYMTRVKQICTKIWCLNPKQNNN